MGGMRSRVLVATLVMITGIPPLHAAEAHAEGDVAQLQRSIEEARAQLDQAARRLATLHTELWRRETTGPEADRPMLGVLIDDAGTDKNGLPLAGVTPGGGAEKAGLKAGDRIVAVNEVRMDEGGERAPLYLLSEALAPVKPGEAVSVEYVRDGRTLEGEVVTLARGEYMANVMEEKIPWLQSLESLPELADLEALEGLEELEVLKDGRMDLSGGNVTRVPAGLRLEDVSGDLAGYFDVEQGVLVLGAPERAQALQAGDVLLEIDGKPVASADTALETLAALEGEVEARVKRRGRTEEVALDADALNAEQAVQVVRGDRRIRIERGARGEQVRLEISVDD